MDLTSMIGNLAGGSNSAIAQIVTDLIKQTGGVEGLVAKFKTAGFEEQAKSWLSNGPQQVINAETIQKVLGSPMIADFATKLGMDTNVLSGQLATLLPQIIHALSSGGNLKDMAGGLLGKLTGEGSSATDALKKLF